MTLLVPLIFLVLALTGALTLFFTLKLDMESRVRQQEVRIDAILTRLKEAEAKAEPEKMELKGKPAAMHSGMNLSQRVQILRLVRQGKSAAAVSETLGIPQAEVELLVRVQHLAAKSASAATTR